VVIRLVFVRAERRPDIQEEIGAVVTLSALCSVVVEL
tara:strand:- start:97916 stop:98026 length:111 start_codon:yes stop_codon:yes gene_type:complete